MDAPLSFHGSHFRSAKCLRKYYRESSQLLLTATRSNIKPLHVFCQLFYATSFERIVYNKAFPWDAYCSLASTIHASTATTRCCSKGGPQMNKFKQVSSDDHQMSLAWISQVWCLGGGAPYLTFPRGTLLAFPGGYSTMWPTPHPHEQTDACENITFP